MRRHALALILTCLAAPLGAAELTLISRFAWETQAVVGVSGIEVLDEGAGFLSVSDQGWWLQGRFERTDGKITGVKVERLEAVIGGNGLPVPARRVGDWSDAEGLALSPSGEVWVSFERWAHVWKFSAPFTRAQAIRDHPTFRDHAENWQLEAAAISPDGTVYVFSEKPLPQGFPIYRLGPDNLWNIDGYLPEQDVFAIVGADFDEDGTLYLLERKLVVGIWWQNRIRRVRLDGSLDEVIWTGDRGEYDNLEGISAWRDEDGLRFLLVSDNNGREANPTEFVEFRLTE